MDPKPLALPELGQVDPANQAYIAIAKSPKILAKQPLAAKSPAPASQSKSYY